MPPTLPPRSQPPPTRPLTREKSTENECDSVEAKPKSKVAINNLLRRVGRVTRSKDKPSKEAQHDTSIPERALHENGMVVEKKVLGEHAEDLKLSADQPSTPKSAELARHDLPVTDWRDEYKKLFEEFKGLQDQLNDKTLYFEEKYGDSLYLSLSSETTFAAVITTLLNNYEFHLKENLRVSDKWQSEHQRCIELDDTLRQKETAFKLEWDSREKSLWEEHAQDRRKVHDKAVADERDLQHKREAEHQAEVTTYLLKLDEEKAERRRMEIKVQALEAKLTSSEVELDQAKQKHEHTLEKLQEMFESDMKSTQTDHKRQIQVSAEAHKKSMDDLEKEHTRKVAHMEEAHEREAEELEQQHEVELKEWNDKMRFLKRNYKAEQSQHAQETSNLEAQIKTLQETHNNELSNQEARHKSELWQAQRKLTNVKMEHVRELETKQEAHTEATLELESKLASLRKQHSIELSESNNTQATELHARDQIHAEEETKLKDKMISLKASHSADLKSRDDNHIAAIRELKRQFREHLAKINVEHAETTRALRATIGEYSGALLERDKITYNMFEGKPFQPLLDAEVETRFVGLMEEVDTFSRLEWKANPSGWPTQILSRLSNNQKTLKRQILKDTVWVILHEFVFCSPFRIFGDEGEVLESKWNEECGVDEALDNGSYVWPKPSMKTERWRYITIRECRAALQKPTPSPYDPLAKLRKGFQASIMTIKEELVATVGDLVTLDQTNISDLEKIALRAARTWLDFGLQRCRINVHMQGENLRSAQEKVEQLQNGLTLVIVPRLERLGTPKGENLDEKEIVGELEGEVEVLKLSKR